VTELLLDSLTTTIDLSRKGQITLPKAIRDRRHFTEHTQFNVYEAGEAIVLLPVKHPEALSQLRSNFAARKSLVEKNGVSLAD
jgi:AbrB family looped-hinge helix DNA binding protein